MFIQLTTLTCSGSDPGLRSLLLLQLPEPPDRRRTDDEDDWPMSKGGRHRPGEKPSADLKGIRQTHVTCGMIDGVTCLREQQCQGSERVGGQCQ